MSIQNRLTDPQYQNWLKGGQALLIVLNGLRQFADKTINDYHGQLKTQLGDAKCQQQCKATKDPGNCAVCGQWKQQMMLNHSNKIVFWKNVDPKLWPSHPWEMAKFYMPRGQKHSVPITADDLDSTHMLNLLNNCKEFHQYFSNKNLPQNVLTIRNQLMHSSNMTVEDATLKTAFDDLLQFLQDKTHLQNLPEVKAAVKEIKELQNMTFALIIGGKQAAGPIQPSMTLETAKRIEESLIKDVMGDFEARLISLESLSNDATEQSGNEDSNEKLSDTIAEWQGFVNDNADLKMKFGDDLQGIKGRCDLLEQKVDVLGVRVDAFMSKATIIFISSVALFAIVIGLLQHQFANVASAENIPLPPASYKNLLQEITVDLKIDMPVYQCLREEPGVKCTVTVDGIPDQTSSFYRSKKEAMQDAAGKAYSKMKVKVTEPEKGKTEGANYKGKLQERQQKLGLATPTYTTTQVTQDGKRFKSKVTISVNKEGASQDFEGEMAEGGKKDAEQRAAKIALASLDGVEDGSCASVSPKTDSVCNL